MRLLLLSPMVGWYSVAISGIAGARVLWRDDCIHKGMSAPPIPGSHDELLRQLAVISSIKDRLERAVRVLVERHGDGHEPVESAKALETAVASLKSEMVRHYLDYRIAAEGSYQAARGSHQGK